MSVKRYSFCMWAAFFTFRWTLHLGVFNVSMSFGVYNLLSHMQGTIYHNEQVLTQLLYGNLLVPNTYSSSTRISNILENAQYCDTE
jgi:hypothetical protein